MTLTIVLCVSLALSVLLNVFMAIRSSILHSNLSILADRLEKLERSLAPKNASKENQNAKT